MIEGAGEALVGRWALPEGSLAHPPNAAPPHTYLSPPSSCSAKGYLLNAAICVMCSQGAGAVQAAVERYKDLDVSFDGSREGKLAEVRIALWSGVKCMR